MIKADIKERRIKTRWSNPNRDWVGATDHGQVPRGGTVYREEYQPDRGPDLDEPLDVTESGDEF